MALAEDAATILDEFVHDVSNLPAEIAHLLEEIQAKDQAIFECRNVINFRDQNLQKHVKAHGGHVKHPREEQFAKDVQSNFDKAQALQDDKVRLSEKACFLLDRHVKRLDIKIRSLQNEGSMPEDAQLPSLLHPSPANLVEPVSANRSGVSTPLQNFNANHIPSNPHIANAAVARMASASIQPLRSAPQAPMAGMQPHGVLVGNTAAAQIRETSVGAIDPRRRRPNATLGTLPMPSSNLARGASTGPGTPKAATPGSRAGSLGPRVKKGPTKKPVNGDHPLRKRLNKTGISKKAARRLKNGSRASPSTTGDDNTDASGSDEDNASQPQANEGGEDEEMGDGGYEEDGDDNELYCTCRNPSHGNMIACDNAKCKFEWFHYECVGLKEEPKGKWLCPDCRKLPSKEIKMSK